MTSTILLYDPTAPHHTARDGVHRPLSRLAGSVVGFIDNAKPNFDHLVDDLAEQLIVRHGVARVVKRRKRSASVPAPDEMVDALAQECDLVITGSGD
jgi:hypothetical protein